jgi:hypothetical protein
MQKRTQTIWLLTSFLAFSLAVAKDAVYHPPRLPDGHVDLQGVWMHTNLASLERPAEFKSLVITAEQAAKIKAEDDAEDNDLSRPNEPVEFLDDRTLQRVRGELRSSIIIEPQNGAIPGNESFKEGKSRARSYLFKAFDGPEQRPLSERCVVSPNASPPVLLIPANDFRQIVQTPNAIVIASEAMHDARIVRMNSTHAPAAIVSWLGDSIGWWEGDTLVIGTKYLMPSLVGRASPYGIYFVSPQTTVTERLTRIAGDQLSYFFSIEDPTFYTQTWKGETVFVATTDPMYEDACHEGNYSLPNGLQGARVLEAAEREKQKGAK